jgi:GTP-binding protein
VVIACNKWDLVKDRSDANSLIDKIKSKFNFFYFAPVFLVSALTGKNVFSLVDQVDSIHEKLKGKIKTAHLNKITRDILNEKKLTTETNRVFNPKYISIESYRPFFITFHTSSKHKLKTFHEQYLKKRITEELDLKGIPIFFKIIPQARHGGAPGKQR